MKTKLKLVICTTNKSKSDDIKYIINEFKVFKSERFEYEVMNLSEFTDIDLGDAPETCDTVSGNAKQKVEYYCDLLEKNKLLSLDVILLSEDTGLFINSLGGAPGAKTARFSGVHDYRKTNELILDLMKDKSNRLAYIMSSVNIRYKEFLKTPNEGRYISYPIYGYTQSLPCWISCMESDTSGFAFDTIVRPIGSSHTYSEIGHMDKDLRIDFLPRTYALYNVLEYIENNY